MTPALTVDTSPPRPSKTPASTASQPSQPALASAVSSSFTPSTSTSRPSSPLRPPVSPLTPTREHASNPFATAPRRTYTHTQEPQTAIPQPALEPIKYDENPDVIALKSTIAILQMQARNATTDIQMLQKIKERAVADPHAFTTALVNGELGKEGPSVPLYTDDDDDVDEEDEDEKTNVDIENKKWPKLPKPQNVVRTPPINWTQYAVVGDPLDKLHNDQVSRPSEGKPQKLGPDGALVFGGDGVRRPADFGIAAPYSPLRDRLDKKKGKR
ncbi:hypothetical protein HYALB_00011422 [Hymenoscyphus albidus]|uniref:Uncharacterized protein n=1 Tax=Hymenoscyphus albidus TaxID=595503 RepID=A0A9N9LTC7_9HELO|nr:hypothetical protein HYALB_00011422 [Hymenoscyphus albidus]